MAPLTPYTFFQCPCSEPSTLGQPADRSSGAGAGAEPDADDEDRAFDPRAPRSNYSLYPLEYLLYCEDCQQIRCPRCVAEEIVTFYCPCCLFEVPSSNLKSEGNRCTRSCFQCPVCIGPLTTTSLESHPDPSLLAAPDNSAVPHSGPYMLTCSYCNWSSTEIGIKFDKSNGIHAQLAKLRNGGTTRLTAKEHKERRKDLLQGGGPSTRTAEAAVDGRDLDVDTQFANLKAFYQNQLADSSSGGNGLSSLGDLGFASPNSLSRIMSIYTGGNLHDKRSKSRIGVMREALDSDEGLKIANLDESEAVEKLQEEGYDATVSTEQMSNQTPNLGEAPLHGRGRFTSELRPVPYLLRTKRSKRCPICRHIISKPEAKVQATRFRIRLVAGSYIPSITIRPLNTPEANPGAPSDTLQPLKPVQFLLTFKNPIFEAVKVTLATPAKTPGRFASKVTVLCPQFEIDANTDVWDEALKDGDKDKRRRRGEDGPHQAEAGKIWERGRNWVSLVIEVVPASLRLDLLALTSPAGGHEVDTGPLREDEDLLEIPMFVRVEWEADAVGDEIGSAPNKDKEGREKRELAYWCVLGLGRVSQS
ncbi:dynactin p62 family-domain-containing protein [Lasiosphaeria miniovina]|uniref:Dynactin subunit 4 n=1 Tax=Lasiosphaeria miniovina TaxID=1954250 RepID=A0AA40B3D3_9PEZI|nr:dynactin p62 family-domain-containing protein [Lasiosphaeria miniovina]KAK0726737.1 dynactin p62 family-domain-containing protein [Lasiosphaeria miniovina]